MNSDHVLFRWENYKGFVDTNVVTLKPITILLGANGSGKTSVLQPFLLLKQTLDKADKAIALMTTGDYVNSGSYYDMVSDHAITSKIKFFFEFPYALTQYKRRPKIGAVPPTKVKFTFSVNDDSNPILHSLECWDCYDRPMLSRELQPDGTYNLNFFSKIEDHREHNVQSIHGHRPRRFLFDNNDVVEEFFSYGNEANSEFRKFEISKSSSLYLSVVSYVEMRMRRFLRSLKYIGPLREPPKRFYEFKGDYHSNVGPKGEFTYSLLKQLTNDSKKEEELSFWLAKFGLARKVKCTRIPGHSELMEIKISPKTSKVDINFSDACFGVSQLLPILVQSLMAEKEDTIICEQPEIHLNPNCETILADFFVESWVNRKVKFVIETHSEHYLLRMRTHIKKGLIRNTDVGIYFIDNSHGHAVLREIPLDEKGMFKDNSWPKGFLEQALTESLMFATAKREI